MKKNIIIVIIVLLVVSIGLKVGPKIWHKIEIHKAKPKAELLFSAIKNAMTLHEIEEENLKNDGTPYMGRCMDIFFGPVKEPYNKSDRDNAAAKCFALYRERGASIPDTTTREGNYTIHDNNFDYFFTDKSFGITEKGAHENYMEAFVNGYIWFSFDLPQEEGSTVLKVEVECSGMEYYKAVCPIISKKLKSTDFGNIEFVFLNPLSYTTK